LNSLVLFLFQKEASGIILFTFPSLVPCACQQLSMFMFPHLFSSFLDDSTQYLTPYLCFFRTAHDAPSLLSALYNDLFIIFLQAFKTKISDFFCLWKN